MLKESLIQDYRGKPIPQAHKNISIDWDEIKSWSDQVYMPYSAQPIGKGLLPNSTMHSVSVADMIVTRFRYGIPVYLDKWNQDKGHIILLTTIEGHGKHAIDSKYWQTTQVGESFIVDCSRTDDYAVHFDPQHLQLNLTIPHEVLARLVVANYGHEAPLHMWQFKTFFGGQNSSWLSLLTYLSRSISEIPLSQLKSKAGEHLQQMIGLHIINEWSIRANIDLNQNMYVTPKYIERAEYFMRENLRLSPTVEDVSKAVGISIKSLSNGFKKYRQSSPAKVMRDMRLCLVREDLLKATSEQTVTEIALACGYLNLGDFARNYYQKFGELPSQTLKK
ncbi:AraC family transcriptional regulator [Acinetobacter bereziniae]|uniref:AraC family transcriptional regulator n=1 Tax=Acinetobacter bereziniae TaxID=106648 RepID=UPI0012508474|nr:helix-turn-helix domain-containing protein [Acinetobacter bereziniae]